MSIKQHIPNSLTLLNLFCGCCGIILCLNGQDNIVPFLIFTALLADFLDGFAARILRVKSDLGAQLDSLADMTTFGVLPSVMVFKLLQLLFFYKNNLSTMEDSNEVFFSYLPFTGLTYAVCACLRLAKFNIDTRQTVNFIGVPTPAGAMFILGLYANFVSSDTQAAFIYRPEILIAATIIISFLMISELPLFSLKGNPLSYKENKIRFVFLLLCIPQIFLFKWLSLSTIIIVYILFSLMSTVRSLQSTDDRE
jgi:CDP-diacylglycerol--serine O-phosphatidyltransferase